MGVPNSLEMAADTVRDLCAAPVTTRTILEILNDCCDSDQVYSDAYLAFQRERLSRDWRVGEPVPVEQAENLLRSAARKARGQ